MSDYADVWSAPEVIEVLDGARRRAPLRQRSTDLQEAVCAAVVTMLADIESEGVVPQMAVCAEVMRSAPDRWQQGTIQGCIRELADVGVFVLPVRKDGRRWIKCVRLSVWGAEWLRGRWMTAPVASWTVEHLRMVRWGPVFEYIGVSSDDDIVPVMLDVLGRVGTLSPGAPVERVERVCERLEELYGGGLAARYWTWAELWADRPEGVELGPSSARLRRSKLEELGSELGGSVAAAGMLAQMVGIDVEGGS